MSPRSDTARRKFPEVGTTSPESLPFRAAPHNLEAEQALLGAILVNNEAHDRVSGFLEPQHFYDPLHQQIYETAAKLIANGKQATPITLRTFFETGEPIDATLTVSQYLGRLAANAATIINARDYGRTIYDLATRRQLIVIGEDMVNTAYDSPVDFPPKEQIDEAQGRLDSLRVVGSNEPSDVELSEAMVFAIAEADAAYRRGDGLSGISTGVPSLDRALGGLVPSNLIILAGRPSMGKTALALNIAVKAAVAGVRTRFYSLEMSHRDLGERVLAMRLGLSAFDLRRGVGVSEHMSRMLADAQECARFSLAIDDSGALSIDELSRRAKRAFRKTPFALLVVDYLQLLRGQAYRGGNHNKVHEVTEISNGLKELAKHLNVPVLALSQLSRETEKRDNRRPQLADLRDSGSIEQDADAVLLLHRPEHYIQREQPDASKADEVLKWQAKLDKARGRSEVIIAKNRHGPPCTVELAFDGRTMTFHDVMESNNA